MNFNDNTSNNSREYTSFCLAYTHIDYSFSLKKLTLLMTNAVI